MPQVFHDCNGWGNHISWTSWPKKLVYGHHTPTPGVGDYWEHRMRSGKIIMEWLSSPRNSIHEQMDFVSKAAKMTKAAGTRKMKLS